VGENYQVVGVRDLRTGTFRLYVNGKPEASASATIAPWDARGSTIIGAALKGRKRVRPFTGTISGVKIFNGSMNDAEVDHLYAPD
jgi:hypothetical protein